MALRQSGAKSMPKLFVPIDDLIPLHPWLPRLNRQVIGLNVGNQWVAVMMGANSFLKLMDSVLDDEEVNVATSRRREKTERMDRVLETYK